MSSIAQETNGAIVPLTLNETEEGEEIIENQLESTQVNGFTEPILTETPTKTIKKKKPLSEAQLEQRKVNIAKMTEGRKRKAMLKKQTEKQQLEEMHKKMKEQEEEKEKRREEKRMYLEGLKKDILELRAMNEKYKQDFDSKTEVWKVKDQELAETRQQVAMMSQRNDAEEQYKNASKRGVCWRI